MELVPDDIAGFVLRAVLTMAAWWLGAAFLFRGERDS